MPFPVPFLPIILIAAVASLVFPFFLKARLQAKRMHTQLLLNQINEIAATPTLVRSKPELNQRLKHSNIDRNSYKLTTGEVLDSWGIPFLLDFGGIPDQIEIRSAGSDKRFHTGDDIRLVIKASKPTP